MTLDARSERNLRGVDPQLVDVVRRAADVVAERGDGLGFIVTEGLRTAARQAELVKTGASWTMDSRHLIGGAVDVAATLAGKVRWDWGHYYRLAAAFKQAAAELGVQVTWGGVWDTRLAELSDDMEDAVADYVARRKKAGLKARIDGPHFQIEPDRQQA